MALSMSSIRQFLIVLNHLGEIAMIRLEKILVKGMKRLGHSLSILFLKDTLTLNSNYRRYMDVNRELYLEIFCVN